ncbi:hypothetical protein [Frondihabitans sucicola]|uniref:hypothetical protein n=1 Tax=Frondihabitans sucicola TaxID=1268041 RepID=UPI0025748750|nr:hypothetical protein [Frondihabitans sucicola]
MNDTTSAPSVNSIIDQLLVASSSPGRAAAAALIGEGYLGGPSARASPPNMTPCAARSP